MTTVAIEKAPLNGVNTPVLVATLKAVDGARDLAKFQFRARSKWVSGTHSRITVDDFFGAGSEHRHETQFVYDGDHPAVLVGQDNGPTPVEYLLVGLAACITAGIGNIAAVRGIELTEVEATITGDIDLLGIFGMSKDVRNGYSGITASFRIRGNAPEEALRALVEQSKARSAVFDVLTNGVPIDLEIDAT